MNNEVINWLLEEKKINNAHKQTIMIYWILAYHDYSSYLRYTHSNVGYGGNKGRNIFLLL